MVSPFMQSEDDILRACRYIKDDRYIANAFGTPLWRVQKLRGKLPKPKPEAREAPIGMTGHQQHQEQMERSSSALLNRILEARGITA